VTAGGEGVEVVIPLELSDGERREHVVRAPSADRLPPSFAPGESAERPLALERVTPEGGLRGCVACGHPELFTRKDFPVGLGLAVVVVAAVLAPFTHYASLLAAAVLDAVLYRWAPDVVECYVCHARHRGFRREPRHPAFDREIDERLRYGKRAVMGKPMREGGTADAPEPEH